MWANTLCPLSSSTRNIAFGSGSETVPSTSIASFFGIPSFERLPGASAPAERCRVGDETNDPGSARGRTDSIGTPLAWRPGSAFGRGSPGQAQSPQPPPERGEPEQHEKRDRRVRPPLEPDAPANGLPLQDLLVPYEMAREVGEGGHERGRDGWVGRQ